MSNCEYLTDAQRYAFSAVVDLRQLGEHPHPEPARDRSPECLKEQKRLEQLYQTKSWDPCLPGNHLKAEVTESIMSKIEIARDVSWNGIRYPLLEIPSGLELNITKGIALLQVLRSKAFSDKHHQIRDTDPGFKWCIVDLFVDADGSRREIAIRQSKPQAIRSILKGALLDAHARQAMTQDQRKAVALVGRTPGLGEAFREVSEIGAYWSVVSPAVFDPCRKNFCIEEMVNYLHYVKKQHWDLTLGANTKVTETLDQDSIELLEGRAPAISSQDRNYISEKFKEYHLFPKLTDPDLRAEVKKAVDRQGPIITLRTFHKDLTVLQRRLHDPLKDVLGPMSRSEHTIRSKVKATFEDILEQLTRTTRSRPRYNPEQRKQFADRCYELLFWKLMRTSTGFRVSKIGLHELAMRVYRNKFLDRPLPIPNSREERYDLETGRRHGLQLFNKPVAMRRLYADEQRDIIEDKSVSASFMARFIASVFLEGRSSASGFGQSANIHPHSIHPSDACNRISSDSDVMSDSVAGTVFDSRSPGSHAASDSSEVDMLTDIDLFETEPMLTWSDTSTRPASQASFYTESDTSTAESSQPYLRSGPVRLTQSPVYPQAYASRAASLDECSPRPSSVGTINTSTHDSALRTESMCMSNSPFVLGKRKPTGFLDCLSMVPHGTGYKHARRRASLISESGTVSSSWTGNTMCDTMYTISGQNPMNSNGQEKPNGDGWPLRRHASDATGVTPTQKTWADIASQEEAALRSQRGISPSEYSQATPTQQMWDSAYLAHQYSPLVNLPYQDIGRHGSVGIELNKPGLQASDDEGTADSSEYRRSLRKSPPPQSRPSRLTTNFTSQSIDAIVFKSTTTKAFHLVPRSESSVQAFLKGQIAKDRSSTFSFEMDGTSKKYTAAEISGLESRIVAEFARASAVSVDSHMVV